MNRDYETVVAFETVDTAELDGFTRSQCFALGVEWANFDHCLRSGESFEMTVHRTNVGRLTSVAQSNGRFVSVIALSRDWAHILVRKP